MSYASGAAVQTAVFQLLAGDGALGALVGGCMTRRHPARRRAVM